MLGLRTKSKEVELAQSGFSSGKGNPEQERCRNDNGRDSITGTVFLYKDDQVIGNRWGYEFFFHYDNRFNKLTPEGNTLNKSLDFFKMLPDEVVIEYFSDRVKEYLAGFIDRGSSNLRRS